MAEKENFDPYALYDAEEREPEELSDWDLIKGCIGVDPTKYEVTSGDLDDDPKTRPRSTIITSRKLDKGLGILFGDDCNPKYIGSSLDLTLRQSEEFQKNKRNPKTLYELFDSVWPVATKSEYDDPMRIALPCEPLPDGGVVAFLGCKDTVCSLPNDKTVLISWLELRELRARNITWADFHESLKGKPDGKEELAKAFPDYYGNKKAC